MAGRVEETDEVGVVDRDRFCIGERMHEQTCAFERTVDEDGHVAVLVVDDGERRHTARFEVEDVVQLFGVRETQTSAVRDARERLQVGACVLREHNENVCAARACEEQVLDADAADECCDELRGLDGRDRLVRDFVIVDVEVGECRVQRIRGAHDAESYTGCVYGLCGCDVRCRRLCGRATLRGAVATCDAEKWRSRVGNRGGCVVRYRRLCGRATRTPTHNAAGAYGRARFVC